MTSDDDAKAKIENMIRGSDSTATNFSFARASQDVMGNSIFYVEYDSKKAAKGESLYYALVDRQGTVKLFDDGIAAVQQIQEVLERRRSLIQRLNEFTLFELVGAAIAIAVTGIVIVQAAAGKVDDQIIGVFGIILGYYFGKTIGSNR